VPNAKSGLEAASTLPPLWWQASSPASSHGVFNAQRSTFNAQFRKKFMLLLLLVILIDLT
jgi:hypothetical protein